MAITLQTPDQSPETREKEDHMPPRLPFATPTPPMEEREPLENAAERKTATADDLVNSILDDLAQKAFLQDSQRLAVAIQMELNRLGGIKQRGVKQAPFAVLRRAAMPAALVETVFISKEFTADAFMRNDKGIITSFMGFQFVEIENLPNVGTYTQLPVWTASAMDFGTWDTDITRVYEDMALRGHPWTTYLYRAYSAARRDPKRIVEIKCKVSE